MKTSHIKVLQLNSSNADFETKSLELRTTVNYNKSDVVLISESNMDTKSQEKLDNRAKDFPDYKFMDKTIDGHSKARMTVMVSNDTKFERLEKLEDNINPLIVFRVKDAKNKWTNCISAYRQWNDPNDGKQSDTEAINSQV